MLITIYNKMRPYIPRDYQIALRRAWIRFNREKFADIWPIDKQSARQPEGWRGWPEKKKFALVLTHDVESIRGQDRCLRLMNLELEMGFRSSFNFVAEQYTNHVGLFDELRANGCEIGLHGLRHHENLFKSYNDFAAQVPIINKFLRDWGAAGFRAPCMYHNLEWTHELDIEYDASTFDTDPFEPQPDGVSTIFPLWVPGKGKKNGYIELPYTLPQDFTLFILLQERNIDMWNRKINWIAEHGGMALLITHPDYMAFDRDKCEFEEYPVDYYLEFLDYVKGRYKNQYWNPLPKEIARFWKEKVVNRYKDQRVSCK